MIALSTEDSVYVFLRKLRLLKATEAKLTNGPQKPYGHTCKHIVPDETRSVEAVTSEKPKDNSIDVIENGNV